MKVSICKSRFGQIVFCWNKKNKTGFTSYSRVLNDDAEVGRELLERIPSDGRTYRIKCEYKLINSDGSESDVDEPKKND